LLRAINAIGDITIATLPDHYPVRKGQSLAGMRIVPLVCPEAELIEAERLNRESDTPLFQLFPFRQGVKAAIIVTGSEVYSGRIQDKFEPVIRAKLQAYEAQVLGCTICDDDLTMLHSAIQRALEQGAELIVMTGGMSVDPDDLTPTAIRSSGARVVTQGLPAQPGNMFTLAYLDQTVIVGVPGAAIHNQTTVFDVLLPQIMAGLPLEKEDLLRLADGGLCQQCKECHWPNCTFGRY
jgi:molybdenum cofactor synthesis domain-containing protein